MCLFLCHYYIVYIIFTVITLFLLIKPCSITWDKDLFRIVLTILLFCFLLRSWEFSFMETWIALEFWWRFYWVCRFLFGRLLIFTVNPIDLLAWEVLPPSDILSNFSFQTYRYFACLVWVLNIKFYLLLSFMHSLTLYTLSSCGHYYLYFNHLYYI